jgi:hypothetical protein
MLVLSCGASSREAHTAEKSASDGETFLESTRKNSPKHRRGLTYKIRKIARRTK